MSFELRGIFSEPWSLGADVSEIPRRSPSITANVCSMIPVPIMPSTSTSTTTNTSPPHLNTSSPAPPSSSSPSPPQINRESTLSTPTPPEPQRTRSFSLLQNLSIPFTSRPTPLRASTTQTDISSTMSKSPNANDLPAEIVINIETYVPPF